MTRFVHIIILYLAISLSALAQVNSEKYQGLLLVGEFAELCTMCEAVLLCAATAEPPAHDAVPAQGEFTLYYIQTRTFWSQVATIWEWFIANFNSESLAEGHTRPVWVYQNNAGSWSGPVLQEAHMALEPAVISFDQQHIDRDSRGWFDNDSNKPLGFCQRMPLWESLDSINTQAPGEPT